MATAPESAPRTVPQGEAASAGPLRLDRLAAADAVREPFGFVVVPDFLSPETVAAVNRDYPKIEIPGNQDLEAVQYGPAFAEVVAAIEGPAMAAALGDKLEVDLTRSETTVTVRALCEQSDGNIHTDHWSKLVTAIVYFNEDWSADEGQLRLLRSATDIEDYVAQVPPRGGTLLAFRRTPNSYHGHKRFVGPRRMVQTSWLRSGALARSSQRLARFATRSGKRVARGLRGLTGS